MKVNSSDEAVVQALRLNDQSAFDAMFRLYYPALCRYAAGFTGGDRDEAEDIVQQTFVKLWEQRSLLDVRWSVRAYLYKMVHNRCLNRLRAIKTREKHREQMTPAQPPMEMPVVDLDNDLQAKLQQALAKLPPQCRQVFELSRFEELKYREIADHLDISVKTVETQMGKALRILRMELSEFLTGACWFYLFFSL